MPLSAYISRSSFSFIGYLAYNPEKGLEDFCTIQEAELFAFGEIRTPKAEPRKINLSNLKINQ